MEKSYRTEDYFVSPANYAPEVTGEFRFPQKVEIHDVTLRDGEQQAGVAFSADDKVAIAELLAAAGIHRIEAGMPAVSKADEEAVRRIVARGLGSKIFVFSRAMEKDIRLAADLGVDGIVLEIPVNEELIEFGYRWPKDKALNAVLSATRLAHELGLYVDLFLMDASRLTADGFVERVRRIREDGWVDACSLVDTQGVLSTPAARYMTRRAVSALDVPVETHFHNDLGLSVANTLGGFEEGAGALHTTVLGIGPRAGQAATEQVAVALKLLYGVDLGIQLDAMYELGRFVGKRASFAYPVNQPIVGDVLYTIESGLPAGWWRNIRDGHPLALYGILPSVMGHPEVQVALGKSSGNASVLLWLEKHGLTLKTEESIPEILRQIKERAIEKKGTLTGDEFLRIVQPYL